MFKYPEKMTAFTISIVKAFQGLYGKYVVTQVQLRDLSTADARKMDLFYKGHYLLLCEALYPDEDWEALLHKQKSFVEFLNETVSVKPTIWGVGIDINALIDRYLPSNRPR